MHDTTIDFKTSAYEQCCEAWKAASRRLKEAEAAEKEAREMMLFMAGGERMEHGVKITEVSRANGYDYKAYCDIKVSSEELAPFKKPDTKYFKVSLY